MKKIINGKKYDTETAKKVYYYHNDRYDFDECEETLYRKITGEFFLHGQGGAMSPYTRNIDQNSWTGSQEIIPLSEIETKEWLEKRATVELCEQFFGLVKQ